MTVIELGELSSGSQDAGPPHRPPTVRDARRVLAAAVVVLCLLALTRSAVPQPRAMPTLWTMPISQTQPFTMHGDTVYVHTAGEAPALQAYDADTGRLRWTYRTKRPVEWVHTFAPGLVMVPEMIGLPDGNTAVGDTVALDERTGTPMWRQPGEPYLAGADGILMFRHPPNIPIMSELRMVRPSDGTQLWSFRPPTIVTSWATGGGTRAKPEWFATVTDEGHVAVYRFADRSLLVEDDLPWNIPDPANERGDFSYLDTHGDVLLLVAQSDGRQTIVAYDVTTLRRLWLISNNEQGGSFPCGKHICLGEDGGVRAVDPRTGGTVWARTGWDYARPLDADRMVYESHRDGKQGLLDVRTGRVVAEFPPGLLIPDMENADLVMLTFSAGPPVPQMVVYRLRDERLQLLGGLGTTTDMGCQLAEGRLACMLGSVTDGYSLVVRDVG